MKKFLIYLFFISFSFVSKGNADNLSHEEKEAIFQEVQDTFSKQNIKLDKNSIIRDKDCNIASDLIKFDKFTQKKLLDKLSKLTWLTSLDLSRNRLQTLPESLRNLKTLTILNLSTNELQTLPEYFGNLQTLIRLDLSSNQLQTLPEYFGNLQALRWLNLSFNQLQILPEAFQNLEALRTLNLSHNKLQTLPEFLGNLKALRELELSRNNIQALPKTFQNLEALTKLYLLNNQLQTLPSSIQNLRSLILLNLVVNPFLLPQGRDASEWGRAELRQHFGDRVQFGNLDVPRMPADTTKEGVLNALNKAKLRINTDIFTQNRLPEMEGETLDGEDMLETLTLILTSLNLAEEGRSDYLSYEVLANDFASDARHIAQSNRDKIWEFLLPRLTGYVRTLYDLPLEGNDVAGWKMYAAQIPETKKALSFVLKSIQNTEDADTKAMLFTQLVHGLLHCPTGQAEGINAVAFALQEGGYKVNNFVSRIQHLLALKKNASFIEAILAKGAENSQNVHLISSYRDRLKEELGLSSAIGSYKERMGLLGEDPFVDNQWNVVKVFYDLVTPERLIQWLMDKTETKEDRLELQSLRKVEFEELSPQEKRIKRSRLKSKTQQNMQFRPLTIGRISEYLHAEGLIKDNEDDTWKDYFTEDPLESDTALLTRDGAKALLLHMGFLIERPGGAELKITP